MSKNNKYGSLKDLMDALRALHAEGISAIADWVPDQIYNLPGKEVVTASRTNSYGTPLQMPKSTIVSMQLKHVPLEMTSKASTVVPSLMN